MCWEYSIYHYLCDGSSSSTSNPPQHYYQHKLQSIDFLRSHTLKLLLYTNPKKPPNGFPIFKKTTTSWNSSSISQSSEACFNNMIMIVAIKTMTKIQIVPKIT